jgi:DNA-binding cell septation regulator SpoVG
MLTIEVVRIKKLSGTGNLLGFADILVNSVLQLTGFSIVKGKEGVAFVSMPQHKGEDKKGNAKYYNDVYFKERADYDQVQKVVLAKFNEK